LNNYALSLIFSVIHLIQFTQSTNTLMGHSRFVPHRMKKSELCHLNHVMCAVLGRSV